MAGFYINGKPISQKKKKGFNIIQNDKTANSLEYDGKNFGIVTDMGLRAIKSNTLDSYTPETEEEKKAIEAYKNYLNEKAKAEERERQKNKVLNPVLDAVTETSFGNVKTDTAPKFTETLAKNFVTKSPEEEVFLYTTSKYGIDPNKFSLAEFSDWAKKHNFNVTYSNMNIDYSPKKEGGVLGIGGKKITTEEEEKDAKLLFELARANANKEVTKLAHENKVVGNVMSAGGGFAQGATFGFFDNIADTLEKAQAKKAGLPEKYQYKTSEKLDSVAQEYKFANIAGNIAGSFAPTKAVYGLASGGLKLVPNFLKLSEPVQKAITSSATFGTTSALNSTGRQIWSEEEWDKQEKQKKAYYKEEYGIDYEVKPYSMGRNIGNILLDTSVGATAGALGSVAGEKVSTFVYDKLKNIGLNPTAIAGLSSASGDITYSLANASIQETSNIARSVANGEPYKPDWESIITDLVISALLSTTEGIYNYKRQASASSAPYKEYKFEFFTDEDMSNPDALKKKFRALSKQYHPDHGGDTETMARLNAEYEKAKAKMSANVFSNLKKDVENKKANENSDSVKNAIALINDTALEGEAKNISVGNTRTTTPDTKTSTTKKTNAPEEVYITKDEKGNKVAYGENAEVLSNYLDLPIRNSKANGEKTVILNDEAITDFLPFGIVEVDTPQTNAKWKAVSAETKPEETTDTTNIDESAIESVEAIRPDETIGTTKVDESANKPVVKAVEAQPIVETAQTNAGVKVGDTFVDTESGSTLKIVSRDDSKTTVEKTTANGEVVTQAINNNIVDKISNNPQYEPETEQPVAEASTSLTTIKNKASVPELFNSATKIVIGRDCIASNKIVLPKTDELVKKLTSGKTKTVVEYNDTMTMARFSNGTNNVDILGEPKVFEKNKNKYYVFSIGDKLYACEQKYLDYFNNGKNTIKACADPWRIWKVFDENGTHIGSIMPTSAKELGITPETFNGLQTVSETKTAKTEAKTAKANAPLSTKDLNAIKKWDRFYYLEENGKHYVSNGHMIFVFDNAQADSAMAEWKSKHGEMTSNAETLGKSFEGFTSFESQGVVSEIKPASTEKTDKRAICIADGIGYLFDKNYADLASRHCKELKVLSNGDWTKTTLVGYDENGNANVMVLPLRNEVETINGVEMFTGKKIDKKEKVSSDDLKKPEKSNIIESKETQPSEASTQNTQNTPNLSEAESPKEIPAQTQKASTEQNESETEGKPTTKNEGTKQIADYVANKLSKGEKISALELATISTKAFGGTMADNVYSVKDAYDAMELGVNKHILSMKDVSAQKMLELLELLPTQTKRTEEMVKFQQFSTPPSIAYLANYVAKVNANDVMLEPSAGIGGIAVFAKKDGATVYVNELDNRRLEVLKNMPFDKFFNEDAEQLDNILGGKIEPTVIVMNPPFSSSSERNIHNTKIGAKHIEQALKILAPNGRLVAIVGHGMGDGAPAFRDWWKDIKSKYNVRANIRINGKNYNKYGTNFDIQMLVIDKNGATTHTETGYVDTLQELQSKLENIREERPYVEQNGRIEADSRTEQKPSELTRKETSGTGKTDNVGIKSVSDADSVADNRKRTDTAGTSRKPVTEVAQTVDGDGRKVDNQAPEITNVVDDGQSLDRRGELGGHTGLQDSGRTDISDSRQHSGESSVDRSDGNVGTRQNDVRVQRPKRTELTDSVFEQYQTQPLKFKNTKAHPGKVSESSAMSAITPPAVTYKPHLSEELVGNGVVSDVQLEAISYAGQSHSQTLSNGTTRGFFLGDGTGIGKGRTIAGMMLDNYNQGRKKAVWVTENDSLMLDAKRDLTALFGNSDLLMQFEGGKKADKIFGKNEAILTVSYSTLSRGYDKKGSNYEKIVDWLGKDFDGLLVFDEAHNMANATGKKGKRGGTKPSQTGLAGIAIQKALPKAKVVYSSATGATEVENLRYAERLGLWGEGTAFTNGDDFVSKIKSGGIASMELIARDMKAMGVYLSRNISYDDVQYDKITHELTPQQVKIYDELAHSWQIVLQNINKALEVTNQGKDGHARGRALGAFWSAHQRFFNQILTSMQVPSVISDIEKQLADGKSCVIQLVSTNESAQDREFERLKSEDLDLDEFDLTPKQMLMSMIEHSFPVEQFEEYRDDEGNKKSKPVYDSTGKPVLNREAVKQRDELLDKLGSIKVPSSPIDMIINHFGTDLVAEKTGRSRRVVQKDGKIIEENIASKKDADVDAFQNGNKRIMIFSKAGGTGKSYHADKSAKNQQQRVHYLLEAGWQADKAVQGFGRSHRSNQVIAPIFKLVTTNLKGQMRFISTIAKRLDQLGAMTKGQRQAGGQGMFSASDNLENALASDVLAVFYKDLLSNRVDGINDGLAIIEKLGLKDKILDEYNNIRVTSEELRDVSKFLNRILSLESSEQNTVFDGYSQRLQDATEKAMADGTLDKGLENYKADRITLNEVQDIREDSRSGAKTKYYNLTAEHKIKPLEFGNIPTENKSFLGYYRNKNTGVVRAVMRTSSVTDQYGNVTSNYKLVGQTKNEYIPQHRLYGNWVEVQADEAKTAWNEELARLPEYLKVNLHLISGVVLPVWDKLPTENVRIYRVLTSDGEMLIGRVVSEDMIDETLRRLGSSRKREKIATKDLIEGIKNGDTAHLENGWKIVQRRVSNEHRIEIVGVNYNHYEMLKDKGVFAERINYATRYFVPTDTGTEKTIDKILEISPVYRVENSKYSIESEDYANGREGNLLPNGVSEWSYSTSSRKQTKSVDGRTRRYKERRTTASERRKYCQALKASGSTRQEVVHGHKCEVIPKEHYTSRMTKISESNKKDGFDETFFITGKATIPFVTDTNGKPKTARGVFLKVNGKKIAIVQYDNEFYMPEQINDHEKVHDRRGTPLLEKAKNIIMNSLTIAEKNHVLEKLSKDYNGVIQGNEDAIMEEFVANVLSDMDTEYVNEFEDIRKAYWKGDEEFIDNYKVSEYAESIEAGGVNSKVLDNIGFGNENELSSSNGLYLAPDEYAVISKAIMAKNAGLSDDKLKPIDYVYSSKNLYVYRNHSLGEFTVISKYDLVTDKEAIPFVKEAIKNGTYRNGQRFNNWLSRIRSKRGRNNGYLKWIENAGTERDDDRLPDGTRRGDDVGYSRGDGTYPSGNYVKYSFESAESDIENLTQERKEEILKQFDKDRVGFAKPSQKELWGERAKWVAHNITRVFPNIPERGEKGTFFAEFRKNMIQWTKLPQTASFMTQDKLNQMTKGLTPEEYKTFAELVYFLDLQEEAQIQKERGYTEILLPNEITPTEVDAIVKVLNEEATENVKRALIKRQGIWDALKTQYIDLNINIGFDADGKFKRKNYYHHQVIEYMNKGSKGTGSNEISIKAGRGWLKERQGSTKAINTDFLAVEYQAMLQMQYDVYIAETLGKIKEQYDIKPQLEVKARNHNKQALNDIIIKEATDKDGGIRLDNKGRPDSETYRQQMWYNSRIMMAFDGLFDLAERNELPTYDGEYAGVVEALKRGNLNASGLYKYIGVIANTTLPENATDAQEQAVIKARTVLKYTSQKREWIKSVLDSNYQTWETIAKSMSDTHAIHQPRRGNYFFTKTVVDDDAFNKAYQEIVLALASGDVDFGNADINKLFEQYADTVRLMGVAYEQWVLPKEIVTTMSEIANPKQAGEVAKLARSILTAWKGWSTGVNPLRTVKYGVRNMLGDLDVVIAGKPQVVMFSKKAVQDIYQAMRHKNYSSDFMEWVERGGYTAMQYVNEMDVEMQNKLFSHLKEKSGINIFKIPLNLVKGYADGVQAVHNFREAILRYSSYLYFKEAIKRNNGNVKDNVASNRYIVRGLNTVEDKAYQLSKDLLGAYDEVGKTGQSLRRYWLPFYSFAETNLKRYFRMFENIIMADDKIPKKAGKLLHKLLMVNMLTLLITAWNQLVMKEEDDKLPPQTRNVPHITLGQNGDNVIAFTKPSSFSDILEWFGLEDYQFTEEDWMAPVDKAWGMVTPFLKQPIELVSGLNFYPSLSQPRSIRDKWEHFFNSWGVAGLYNEVTGKPTKGWGELVKGAFVYSYDYEESAYYEILDIKSKFQGKTDNTIYGTDAKSNALYYMKKAVKYKDEEIAYKYLDEYFKNGGTANGIRQSLQSLNPFYGFTSKDTYEKGNEFLASLTEDEKEKMKIAYDYYTEELMMPEELLSILGKKGTTEEDAKRILKAYIKARCKE